MGRAPRMLISTALCLFSFILIILFVVFSGTCAPEARHALDIFLSSVLPVMLPFYILSSLIVSSGAAERLCSPVKQLTAKLFKLPAACGAAVILGLICGFPIGARITCDLKTSGYISDEEAARLSAFTNNVGPVFMASVVGSSYLGSVKVGLLIWLSAVISALLCGILMSRASPRASCSSSGISPSGAGAQSSASFHITDIPSAIMNSVNTALYVGAVIIFFASLSSLVKLVPHIGSLPRSLIYSFLEMTGGLSALTHTAVSLSFGLKCMLISAAAAWSGCSVHMQVCGILASGNVRIRYYLIGKILQSVMSPLIMCFLLIFL